MADRSFSHAALVAAPQEIVWRELQHAETWAAIGGVDQVVDPRHDGGGLLLGYRFTANVGGRRFEGHAETVDATAPFSMTVVIFTPDVEGRIAVSLIPEELDTRMAVSLTARPRSVFAGVFFPMIAAAIGAGLPEQIDAFAARLSD
jgi:hypothetical protein